MDSDLVLGDALPLQTFVVEQRLSDDPREKRAAVLGRFEGHDGQAVLVLTRRHFELEQLAQLLAGTSTSRTFKNDIYAKYTGEVPLKHSLMDIDVIWPATGKHIRKHTAQRRHLVRETPEMHAAVVLPYLQALPPSRVAWVHNILSRQAEAERLIFEDPDPLMGFMLHPDLKWDQVQKEELYCVALCHRRDIGSVRDLRAEHLPLLDNIRARTLQVVLERFSVEPDQLRLFVHYQPSYYHFHVHVVHVDVQGAGLLVGKAILLDDIIDHLQRDGSHYARATLTYTLGEADELWAPVSEWQRKQQAAQAGPA